jgi:hypothetical protein
MRGFRASGSCWEWQTKATPCTVARVAIEIEARRHLDDLSQIHHRDAVADVLDDRQVVRNEQVGQRHLFLQVAQQLTICAWMERREQIRARRR